MYYPASDTIVDKWPQWRVIVERLDNLLHDNAGEWVRTDWVTVFLEEDEFVVNALLQEYEERACIEICQTKSCAHHPQVVRDPSDSEESFHCDLCDSLVAVDEQSSARVMRVIAQPTIEPEVSEGYSGRHVFVSHSSDDKPFVRELVKDARTAVHFGLV